MTRTQLSDGTDGESYRVDRRRVLAGMAAGAASLVGFSGLAAADCTCYCVDQRCTPDKGCWCEEYECVGDNCPD